MTRPVGPGWWVAFEAAIDDGPKAADLAKALAVCEATGATWVCLRAGDGGHADAHLTEASILAFKEQGISVLLWPFVYGHDIAGTLAICKRWRGLCLPGGEPAVDGIVLNAEFDFMAKATADQARALVHDVRAIGYDFVAHAPPDYAGGRGEGPLAVLDEVCDAILPQTYGPEHNDQGHVHHIDAVLALYKKRGYGLAKVWPILCSYRPKFRGYDRDKRPIPTPPLKDEAAVVAADVVAGMDHLAELGCSAPSIYTIDALHFASRPGVGDAVLAALTARYQRTAPATDPSPPPDPIDIGAHSTDWRPESAAVAMHDMFALDSREPDTQPDAPEPIRKSSSSALKRVRPENDPPPEAA